MTIDSRQFVERRTALKAVGLAAGSIALGGAGLVLSTRRASATLDSNTLTGNTVSISGDGGDVTGFELGTDTSIDLSWEGFDADVDSVTFTLQAERTQVGTGADEATASGNLSPDSGSTGPVTLFTDSPSVLSSGRNGSVTYASTDLATSFPFAIIANGTPGANVEGVLTDGNIDAASLSNDSEGDVKVNEITFTLTAVLSHTSSGQSVEITETGTMNFVVENLAAAITTGGTLSGSGSAE